MHSTEYAVSVARDALAYTKLAAEALVKEPTNANASHDGRSDGIDGDDADGIVDDAAVEKLMQIAFEDVGYAGWEDLPEDMVELETSRAAPLRPLKDYTVALQCAFQYDAPKTVGGRVRPHDTGRHY